MRLMSPQSQSGVEDLEDSWRAADLQSVWSPEQVASFSFYLGCHQRALPRKDGLWPRKSLTGPPSILLDSRCSHVDNQGWPSQ